MPAAEIEAAVIDQLRGIFRQPEIIVGTWRAARAEQDDVTEAKARNALTQASRSTRSRSSKQLHAAYVFWVRSKSAVRV